jgi:hypothetical protein
MVGVTIGLTSMRIGDVWVSPLPCPPAARRTDQIKPEGGEDAWRCGVDVPPPGVRSGCRYGWRVNANELLIIATTDHYP